MKKFFTLLFCLSVAGISAYSLLWPNYVVQSVVESNEIYVALRAIIVILLLTYTFLPEIRNVFTKLFVSSGGILFLTFGIITMFSPMFFGQLDHYVPLGDVFIFLEGGILMVLAGIEAPTNRIRLRAKAPLPPEMTSLVRSGFLSRQQMIYNSSIRNG
ncbi:hypothetical protein H0X10_03170 [Candidatus Saccharibacteria bacterium]|nr:hypothetical protein [Candidatus Saccharibacteria bacterium]